MMLSKNYSLLKYFILVIAMISLVSLVLLHFHYEEEDRVRTAQMAELDQKTLLLLVQEIDAACTKLGRAPKDERELEELLGKPLPFVHGNKGRMEMSVSYRREGDREYTLDCITDSGFLIFESGMRKAGWTGGVD